MVNDDFQSFARGVLEGLANDLTPIFGLVAVRNEKLWCAIRHKPSDPLRKNIEWAKYCFEFHFPAPVGAKGKPEFALDAYQSAIWAYCAGLEYLRTGDPDLNAVLLDMAPKWWETKKSISVAKSFMGSENSAKQNKVVDWEKIKPDLESGKSIKEIACFLGVTDQAVGKVARKNGWSRGKKQPP